MDHTKRAALVALFFVVFAGLAFLLWKAADIVLLTFAGVLVAVAIRAAADPLAKRTSVGGTAATGIVLLVTIGLFVGAGFLAAPSVREQAQQLRQQLPQAVEQVDRWLTSTGSAELIPGGASGGASGGEQADGAQASDAQGSGQRAGGERAGGERAGEGGAAARSGGQPTEGGFPSMQQLREAPLSSIGGWVLRFAGTITQILAGFLFVVATGVWLALNPKLYRKGVLRLMPPRAEARTGEVLHATGHQLRWWALGQLISMVIVGVLTGLGLWFLGMPMALLLGIVAGLLEIVPNFGPIAAAVPALLLAATTGKVLEVAILYAAIQGIESYILRPLVQQETVDLPPALLLAVQVLMGVLFGFVGVLVAAPVLVVVMVLVRELWVVDTLDEEPTL